MKSKLLVAASLLAISVTASAMPAKPKACPSASALHDVGLSREIVVRNDRDQTWIVGHLRDNYGTKNDWSFLVANVQADDEDDAYNKANESLNSLSFAQGPVALEQISKWACVYNTSEGYLAVSVTPAFDGANVGNVTSYFK